MIRLDFIFCFLKWKIWTFLENAPTSGNYPKVLAVASKSQARVSGEDLAWPVGFRVGDGADLPVVDLKATSCQHFLTRVTSSKFCKIRGRQHSAFFLKGVGVGELPGAEGAHRRGDARGRRRDLLHRRARRQGARGTLRKNITGE